MNKPVNLRLIIKICLCLALAAGAYAWASASMDAIYAYRSPITESPPKPGSPVGRPITKHVVWVLIDGLRYDTSRRSDVMPVLNRLRREGAGAQMHSQSPSFSQPGYSTLLTGAWPDINSGPGFNIDYEDIPALSVDNIFSAARRSGLSTGIAAFNWFDKLLPPGATNASFYTPRTDRQADADVMSAAQPMLDEGIQFLLIHLDQVDDAGDHGGGPFGPNWDPAARQVDAYLETIVSQLDPAQDTLVVCSDHGHIDAGGHGGNEAVTLVEPLVFWGAGIKPGDYGNVQMTDLAPTLAVLLGTNIPAASQGRPLIELLTELSADERTALENALADQQRLLVETYNTAIGGQLDTATISAIRTPEETAGQMTSLRMERLQTEREGRILVMIVLWLGVALLLFRNHAQKSGWILGAALLALLLFNLGYGLIAGRMYSYSSVLSEEDLMGFVALAGGVSLLLAWAILVLKLGLFKDKATSVAETGLDLTLTLALFLTLPVLVSYVWNVEPVQWTLPDFGLQFLSLLSLIFLLMASIIGLLLAGISALIAVTVVKYRGRNAGQQP